MFCLHFDMGKFSGNFVQPSFFAPFFKEMDFSNEKIPVLKRSKVEHISGANPTQHMLQITMYSVIEH